MIRTTGLRYALGTLRRHPAYVALNTVSLALAIGCCLLLFWYIRFHLSVDRYHRQADRVVRLVTELHMSGLSYSQGIPTPVGPALRQDMPWLTAVAMVVGQEYRLIQVESRAGQLHAGQLRAGQLTNKFTEARTMAYVEPDYFRILDYSWLVGSPDSSLRQPFAAVVTRRLARKYFGTANPIGRHLCMNNRLELTITGLLADLPDNTDQPYELFVSYKTLDFYAHNGTALDQWAGISSPTQCWVLLPTAESVTRLAQQLVPFHRKRHPASLDTYQYRVLPLTAQHTAPNYYTGIPGDVLLVLAVIGGLLLLTACVNFINMATAQALRRGREIGVRRVIGATRRRVFWQFLIETALITSLAVGVAIVLAYSFLPILRQWTQTPVPFRLDLIDWGFLLGMVVLVTGLAGTYPGLVLAGFKPVLVLNGQATQQQIQGLPLRRLLIIGQLAINMAFVTAVLVMNRQLSFWLQADSGFYIDQRVTLPVYQNGNQNLARFRQELLQIDGVEAVSYSSKPPIGGTINTYPIRFADRPTVEPYQMVTMVADSAYVPFFGIRLLAGRQLPDCDTVSGFLLNATAVRMLGFSSPEQVIGKLLTIPYRDTLTRPIVGVVGDWWQEGFKKPVLPTVLFTNQNSFSNCHLRLATGRKAAIMARVQAVWERYFPDNIYGEVHLDEVMTNFYAEEAEQFRFVQLAAGVAIAIGTVGLLGLVIFLTSRRTREIAIRKAVGASEGAIVWLFLREFTLLLAVAFGLATPLVWWLMNQWLSRYETHIAFTPDLLGMGLLLVTVTTLLTVLVHTLRAARTNPARALRTD
ncbi:FtsX-like permease family protein [uncultured Spirosoma sp.]|uniref:FtsX-like permease family protein n=1 Tax=uncultured Spirosoma sp. TaxID=278208 RepID=UPI0025911BFD|nr:FtsX-like permease family protein [uncultured Spirosoma sp.]